METKIIRLRHRITAALSNFVSLAILWSDDSCQSREDESILGAKGTSMERNIENKATVFFVAKLEYC